MREVSSPAGTMGPRFQLTYRGRAVGPPRVAWYTAAQDAVAQGVGFWRSPTVISLDDGYIIIEQTGE